MGFWSSVCSGFSSACSSVRSWTAKAVNATKTFVETKVAPAIDRALVNVGRAIQDIGEKMQGRKQSVVYETDSGRGSDGKTLSKDALLQERNRLVGPIKKDIVNYFEPLALKMAYESGSIYNEMRRQWEEQFEGLDLSREGYDIQQAQMRIKHAVEDKVKAVVTPSDPHFLAIAMEQKGTKERELAYDAFVSELKSKVCECFDRIVETIFKEQIENLFKKLEDHVSSSEKQMKKTVEELKKLVEQDKTGIKAKDGVICEAVAMIHKCDYLSDMLETA